MNKKTKKIKKGLFKIEDDMITYFINTKPFYDEFGDCDTWVGKNIKDEEERDALTDEWFIVFWEFVQENISDAITKKFGDEFFDEWYLADILEEEVTFLES